MATPTTMPPCGHATALKFNSNQPRELRRYFSKLDLLFTACGITDDEIQKKHACQYINIDTSELWESIPEYAATIPYARFRIAVHVLYPGSEEEPKRPITDMDKIVGEQLHVGIYNTNELGSYF
jgi:hypothetical protein